MSRRQAVPNEALKSIIVTVAERERARREKNGEACQESVLGLFAELVGGISKPGLYYWIANGGAPRARADQLREILSNAGLRLDGPSFERLLLPAPAEALARGENKALRRVLDFARSEGIQMHVLASGMGMSYWQLYRCERQLGGLPEGRLPDFIRVLRRTGVLAAMDAADAPIQFKDLAECLRPGQKPGLREAAFPPLPQAA